MNLEFKATLGNIELTVSGYIFTNDEFPVSIDEDQAGEITESAYGTTIINGSSFEPKRIWTFSTASLFQGDTTAETLRELWSEYDYLRRTGGDNKITIEDSIQYYHERSPRTRALATGASEIATTSGRIKYYAKYYGYFTRPPVIEIGYGLSFQMREGGIFSA